MQHSFILWLLGHGAAKGTGGTFSKMMNISWVKMRCCWECRERQTKSLLFPACCQLGWVINSSVNSSSTNAGNRNVSLVQRVKSWDLQVNWKDHDSLKSQKSRGPQVRTIYSCHVPVQHSTAIHHSAPCCNQCVRSCVSLLGIFSFFPSSFPHPHPKKWQWNFAQIFASSSLVESSINLYLLGQLQVITKTIHYGLQ